jgi:hypothetical protein
MTDKIRVDVTLRSEPISDHMARVIAAVRERCTCRDRDQTLPLMQGHEPDCSLWNTGWLT